jgi:hypothetical protein
VKRNKEGKIGSDKLNKNMFLDTGKTCLTRLSRNLRK